MKNSPIRGTFHLLKEAMDNKQYFEVRRARNHTPWFAKPDCSSHCTKFAAERTLMTSDEISQPRLPLIWQHLNQGTSTKILYHLSQVKSKYRVGIWKFPPRPYFYKMKYLRKIRVLIHFLDIIPNNWDNYLVFASNFHTSASTMASRQPLKLLQILWIKSANIWAYSVAMVTVMWPIL